MSGALAVHGRAGRLLQAVAGGEQRLHVRAGGRVLIHLVAHPLGDEEVARAQGVAAPLALVGPAFETAGIIIGGIAFAVIAFVLYRWVLQMGRAKSA